MLNIHLKSIGYYIPNGRKTNEDILRKFKEVNQHLPPAVLDDILYANQRKLEFLGLKTRTYGRMEDGDNAVNMAIKATKDAFSKGNIEPSEIDCVIFTAGCNPFREPTFALLIARQMGIPSADCFDLNDSCNAFVKAFEISDFYLNSGKYRNVLIVTSEHPYEVLKEMESAYYLKDASEADYKVPCLLPGCGAAAVVVSAGGDRKRVVNYAETRSTKDWDIAFFLLTDVYIPPNRFGTEYHGPITDGRDISALVLKEFSEYIRKTLDDWHMAPEDIDFIASHQLGRNITFGLLDLAKIDHRASPFNTFPECGNMGTANIPVNLALAEEKGLLKPGDSILLLSSFLGLAYSVTHIIW